MGLSIGPVGYPYFDAFRALCCPLPVFFRSDTKFSSGCGWPAFYDNLPDTVQRHEDNAFGMKRIEITCKNCGGHLGHVFQVRPTLLQDSTATVTP